jgi:Cadherin-like
MAAVDSHLPPMTSTLTLQVPLSASTSGTAITYTAIGYKTNTSGTLPIRYDILSMTPNIGTWSKTSFTQTEISTNPPKYLSKVDNYTIEKVKVSLKITDPNDGSSTIKTFTIKYTLKDVAPIGSVSDITLDSGTCVTLSTTHISFTDVYQGDSGIFFNLQTLPQHGDLKKNGVKLTPGSEFTQDDVNNGLITYCAWEGDTGIADALNFKVRDTNNQWSNPAHANETVALASIYTINVAIVQHDEPLLVTRTGPLNVHECGTEILTNELILAEDVDDPTLPVTYTITQLVLDSNGLPVGALKRGSTVLSVGDTFTNDEIIASAIIYDNMCSTTAESAFKFTASNTKSTTAESTFIIKLIPDVTPTIDTNILNVTECNEITTGLLNDASANITITLEGDPAASTVNINIVEPLPTQGKLYILPDITNAVTAGTQITYQQVLNKTIGYVHNCLSEEIYTDTINFELVDSPTNIAFSVPVAITHIPVPDIPLAVTKKGPASVNICGFVVITQDLLFAEDTDNTDLEIEFKVTSLPVHGTLYKNATSVDPTATSNPSTGTTIALNGTFSLQDVIDNKIYYIQDCSNTASDSFRFDCYHPTTLETVSDQAFNFTSVLDLPPEVSTRTLTVNQGSSVVVTSSDLIITDPEGKLPSQLIITYTSPVPAYGKFKLNGANITSTFTYQDVLDGKLSYKHNGSDQTIWTDAGYFTVTDGINIVSFALNITVIHVVDNPPYMKKNVTQNCERTGSVTWDETKFIFDDPDTAPALVFWQAISAPTYGTVTLNGSAIVFDATNGTTIALSDWTDMQFIYTVTSTIPLDVTSDSFEFKLSDESNVVSGLKLNIKFPEPTTVCPTITKNVDYLNVQYLKDNLISDQALTASTAGVRAIDHVYTITANPSNGVIVLNSVELVINGTFTQKDILNGKVFYRHKTGLPDYDSVKLEVNNGFCQKPVTLPFTFIHMLSIDVNAQLTNNVVSTSTITNDYLLSSSLLTSFATAIIYTLVEVPLLGALYLSGTELSAGDTFTQADINNSRITYVSYTYTNDESLTTQPLTENDSFDFSVTDGVETLTDTFDILLNLPDQPPELILNGLTVNTSSCNILTFGSDKSIFIQDDRSSSDELVLTLTGLPNQGSLLLSGTELELNDTFTWEDIVRGRVRYCTTATTAGVDSFMFNLVDSGGNALSNNTYSITIYQPPVPEITLRMSDLTVSPCVETTLYSINLTVTNLPRGFDTVNMVFTLTSLPSVGILYKDDVALASGDTFTLDDIVGKFISYKSTTNPEETSTDTFKFNVSSSDSTVSFTDNNNTFTININGVQNPPLLYGDQKIVVFENSNKVITSNDISLRDISE